MKLWMTQAHNSDKHMVEEGLTICGFRPQKDWIEIDEEFPTCRVCRAEWAKRMIK